MPTKKQEVEALVRAGFRPADARRIVEEVDARGGRLMTPGEVNAAAEVTKGDVESARQWWLYQKFVPARFKKLLAAKLHLGDTG